jgi:hypothetical protein
MHRCLSGHQAVPGADAGSHLHYATDVYGTQCVLSTATLAQAERSIGACGIDHVIGGCCEGDLLIRNILVGYDTSEAEAVIAQSRQVIAYAHCAVTVVRQATS